LVPKADGVSSVLWLHILMKKDKSDSLKRPARHPKPKKNPMNTSNELAFNTHRPKGSPANQPRSQTQTLPPTVFGVQNKRQKFKLKSDSSIHSNSGLHAPTERPGQVPLYQNQFSDLSVSNSGDEAPNKSGWLSGDQHPRRPPASKSGRFKRFSGSLLTPGRPSAAPNCFTASDRRRTSATTKTGFWKVEPRFCSNRSPETMITNTKSWTYIRQTRVQNPHRKK